MLKELNEFVVFLIQMFPIFFIIGILISFLVVLHVRDNKRMRDYDGLLRHCNFIRDVFPIDFYFCYFTRLCKWEEMTKDD